MFDRVDFRKDGKTMRENEERKPFEWCLVGRGKGKRDGGT